MATINDYRQLGAMLSPSEHVSLGEIPNILSAVLAHEIHGDDVLAAAAQGPQAVADFYHEKIAAQAQADGVDAPVKGAPVFATPDAGRPVTTATTGPGPGEFAALVRQIETLTAAVTAINERESSGAQAPAPPSSVTDAKVEAAPEAPDSDQDDSPVASDPEPDRTPPVVPPPAQPGPANPTPATPANPSPVAPPA